VPQIPERTRTEGAYHAESLELPIFKSRRGLHLRIIHTTLCSSISHKSSTDVDIPNALHHFFSSPHMHVLTWIDYIAIYSDLKRLINTGKTIKKLLQRRAKHTNPFRCGKEVTLLNSWLVDLVPLVANFGERKRRNRKSFLENPASIYHLLPLFCQPESAPLKPFLAGIHGTSGMQLAGLSNKT
jgi:hypothetical protein